MTELYVTYGFMGRYEECYADYVNRKITRIKVEASRRNFETVIVQFWYWKCTRKYGVIFERFKDIKMFCKLMSLDPKVRQKAVEDRIRRYGFDPVKCIESVPDARHDDSGITVPPGVAASGIQLVE